MKTEGRYTDEIKNLRSSEIGGLQDDPNAMDYGSVLKKSSLKDLGTDARSFAISLLERCKDYWYDLQDMRDDRKRNRDFVLGKQWEDEMPDPDSTTGEYITEEAYLLRQGKNPNDQQPVRATYTEPIRTIQK